MSVPHWCAPPKGVQAYLGRLGLAPPRPIGKHTPHLAVIDPGIPIYNWRGNERASCNYYCAHMHCDVDLERAQDDGAPHARHAQVTRTGVTAGLSQARHWEG
eukprot:COSAG02_NODE_3135_length_7303_cov_11.100222_3_plen_102_part_00